MWFHIYICLNTLEISITNAAIFFLVSFHVSFLVSFSCFFSRLFFSFLAMGRANIIPPIPNQGIGEDTEYVKHLRGKGKITLSCVCDAISLYDAVNVRLIKTGSGQAGSGKLKTIRGAFARQWSHRCSPSSGGERSG